MKVNSLKTLKPFKYIQIHQIAQRTGFHGGLAN